MLLFGNRAQLPEHPGDLDLCCHAFTLRGGSRHHISCKRDVLFRSLLSICRVIQSPPGLWWFTLGSTRALGSATATARTCSSACCQQPQLIAAKFLELLMLAVQVGHFLSPALVGSCSHHKNILQVTTTRKGTDLSGNASVAQYPSLDLRQAEPGVVAEERKVTLSNCAPKKVRILQTWQVHELQISWNVLKLSRDADLRCED
mmetsp:Transcript_63051/g.150234  ORF Transcript_63051/g.150234 Transcript_63051/m.150234 type:complete len:203 (-) Transcript_63051:696-1304(-)